jgi:hypothetical protein
MPDVGFFAAINWLLWGVLKEVDVVSFADKMNLNGVVG